MAVQGVLIRPARHYVVVGTNQSAAHMCGSTVSCNKEEADLWKQSSVSRVTSAASVEDLVQNLIQRSLWQESVSERVLTVPMRTFGKQKADTEEKRTKVKEAPCTDMEDWVRHYSRIQAHKEEKSDDDLSKSASTPQNSPTEKEAETSVEEISNKSNKSIKSNQSNKGDAKQKNKKKHAVIKFMKKAIKWHCKK